MVPWPICVVGSKHRVAEQWVPLRCRANPIRPSFSRQRSNYMNSDSDTGKNLRPGGENVSVTPSTALLNQRLAISSAPRMLEPSEIDLLRKSKEEIYRASREIFAEEESVTENQKTVPRLLVSYLIAPIAESCQTHFSTWSILETLRPPIEAEGHFGAAAGSGGDNVSYLPGNIHGANQEKRERAVNTVHTVWWVNGTLNVIRL